MLMTTCVKEENGEETVLTFQACVMYFKDGNIQFSRVNDAGEIETRKNGKELEWVLVSEEGLDLQKFVKKDEVKE
jgi:hypothetical protein